MVMEIENSSFNEMENHDCRKLNSEDTNILKSRYEKAVVSIIGLLADCTATMYKTSATKK